MGLVALSSLRVSVEEAFKYEWWYRVHSFLKLQAMAHYGAESSLVKPIQSMFQFDFLLLW